MPEQNSAVQSLARWVIKRAAQLMTDATRWEILIVGKGDKYTCKYSVYEDNP